ncbi:substrate-binding domain-containing protein [Tessaracoccus coleopterorum]|uniref:substrate-binding domain-containing protein n=1 Tax=Tessaracoccus coleopterorum TaxID=2714950 RepID=UPI0018D369AF
MLGWNPARRNGNPRGHCPAATATPEAATASPQTADAVVFAAASLNTVFPGIAAANYSFDGSSGLVDQLKGGAPADVFASADRKNMDKAVEAGLIDGDPVLFATNYLVLVTPADNPAGITGFDDSLDGVKLVVCAPDVPCGAATVKAAEANGIELRPVSEEAKVTDVLGKVTAGRQTPASCTPLTPPVRETRSSSSTCPAPRTSPTPTGSARSRGSQLRAGRRVHRGHHRRCGAGEAEGIRFRRAEVTRYPRWALAPTGLALALLGSRS